MDKLPYFDRIVTYLIQISMMYKKTVRIQSVSSIRTVCKKYFYRQAGSSLNFILFEPLSTRNNAEQDEQPA